jgi:ketosteroid isomerase-like protein
VEDFEASGARRSSHHQEELVVVWEAQNLPVEEVGTGQRNSTSGVPIELPDARVHTLRDGRLTSTCVYRDRSKALEAAVLRHD